MNTAQYWIEYLVKHKNHLKGTLSRDDGRDEPMGQ
jgi:hypothetical protein